MAASQWNAMGKVRSFPSGPFLAADGQFKRLVIVLAWIFMTMVAMGWPLASRAQALFSTDAPIGQNFGVQLKPWHTSDADLTQIKAMGFGLVRWSIAWDAVETAPGHYDWSESDAFFRRLKAAGLRSVVIIGRGNPIYSGVVPSAPNLMSRDNSSPAPPSDDQEYAVFAAFAAAAAKRYAVYNPMWEIWNEPDLDHFWPPRAKPDHYAALALKTCEAIRRVSPESVIIGPGGAAMPNAVAGQRDNIYQSIIKNGAIKCLSAVSGHAYRIKKGQPIPSPESVQVDNLSSRQWLKAGGAGNIPYICSEWGYVAPLVRPEEQAAYPLRAHLANLLSGAPLTIWYEWRDSKREPDNPESHYGLVDYDGHPKAGATNLSTVLPMIAQARLIKRVPLKASTSYAVVVRQPDGTYGLVYWSAITGQSVLSVGQKTVNMTIQPAYLALGAEVPPISSAQVTR